MADTPKHSVSVAGIVVDDQDRVLVIQRRDNGHWEPPGGVLELDETPEDGVRREVLEETGAKVEPVRLTGVYKNMSLGVIALVYRCSLLVDGVDNTAEARSVSWLPLNEVKGSMSEAYAIRIEDAVNNRDVRTRSHDGLNVLRFASPEVDSSAT